jgi:hypothetical protein
MVNSKSTKTEILAAFQQLEQEKAELLAKIKKIQSEKTPAPIPVKNPPEKPPVIQQNISSKFDIQQTISSLENLQISFGSSVSNLSERLITEATKLVQIKTTLASEIDDLKALHNIETITDVTLDDLIQEYENTAKNQTEELNLQAENLELQLLELQQNWQKQKENHQREIQKRNDNYQKEKTRNEQEYQYNLAQIRLISEEEFDQQKARLYKELAEAKQQQEKLWQQREESVHKKEREYAEAQQKVTEFEEQLRAKIKQGEGEGKGIGNYQVKVKTDLRNKEIEGERRNYQLRIANLEDTIANHQERIDNLSHQLESALRQVQDLAVKAIEGTSNRNSYEAMKEIALEQAKNTQKNK